MSNVSGLNLGGSLSPNPFEVCLCAPNGGFWSSPASFTNYRFPDNISEGVYSVELMFTFYKGQVMPPANAGVAYGTLLGDSVTCSPNVQILGYYGPGTVSQFMNAVGNSTSRNCFVIGVLLKTILILIK
jgi:hypothetical protein